MAEKCVVLVISVKDIDSFKESILEASAKILGQLRNDRLDKESGNGYAFQAVEMGGATIADFEDLIEEKQKESIMTHGL